MKRTKPSPLFAPQAQTLPDSSEPAKEPEGPTFVRRHRTLIIATLGLVVAACLAAIVFAFVVNESLDDIERIDLTLDARDRPTPTAKTEALNILLLGADAGVERNGRGTSIARDAAKSKWPTGKYRSDTIMLVHIPADRDDIYLVSIPRDSFVGVFDRIGQPRGTAKINAALSLYGPSGAVSTVENFSGLRMDHLVMLDWDGFGRITDAIGGVRVQVPHDVYQDGRLAWPAGGHVLKGKKALEYVRNRQGLRQGDFDRINRQQNFLREVLTKLVDQGTFANPIKRHETVEAVTSNLAVDSDFDTGKMRSFAFSLRDIDSAAVHFMTLPTDGTATDPVSGSIVVVDPKTAGALFDAISSETMDDYLQSHPETLLADTDDVR